MFLREFKCTQKENKVVRYITDDVKMLLMISGRKLKQDMKIISFFEEAIFIMFFF